MSWDGRELISQTLSNGTTISYAYNSSGIRTQKTYGTSYRKDYLLDGTTIVAEIKTNLSNNSKETIYYFYDETGVAGFEYNGAKYHYVKNLQGDIISIQNANGIVVVNYAYDAWGNVLSISGTSAVTIGTLNPFRYRGYYYDTETGYYYLNSRYYDPVVGRCLNADKVDIISAAPTALTDKNLYAYCDNNPIIRVDHGGEFWDTVFDVVSLAFSIAEVCADPSDPWAWAGVVGDAVDLIPFVTGVGEVTRVVKTVNRVVETVDTTYDVVTDTVKVQKAIDFTDEAADLVKKLDRSSGYTKSTRPDGIKIHKGYKATPEFNSDFKEYDKVDGIRPDYLDLDNKIIYELKPNNPRSIRSGVRQLRKYNRTLGGGYTLILEVY